MRESILTALKSLWSAENNFRSAVQSAFLLRKDEAKRYMNDANTDFAAAKVKFNEAKAESDRTR